MQKGKTAILGLGEYSLLGKYSKYRRIRNIRILVH